jgi:type IV secretory pathway TrbD component
VKPPTGDARVGRRETSAAQSATLRIKRVILPPVSRSAAFLVGIVAFVAFAGLYALSWIAAFAFLALWLAATVLYRRRHRP